MAQKKKRRDYSMIKPDPYNGNIEPERIRIESSIDVDRDCFKKTPTEKEQLKYIKSIVKYGIVKKKRCRPGKEQRHRLWERRQAL